MKKILTVSLFLCVGCSSNSEEPTIDAALHRAEPVSCSTDRESVNERCSNPLCAPGETGGYGAEGECCECESDVDCADGDNGRCVSAGENGPICSYDECFTDDDCDDGFACVCDADDGANVCVRSNCRVDSDCDQYCSPAPEECGPPTVACQSPEDECLTNDDCNSGHCRYTWESPNPKFECWQPVAMCPH